MQENFKACLEGPGDASICSAPGALMVLAARGTVSRQPAGRPPTLNRPIRVEPKQGSARLDPGVAAGPLANIQIIQGPNGTWKCTSTGGAVCSDTEIKLFTTTVNKSRSNVKNNLTVGPIAPDGTFHCFSADKKPCSEAEVHDLAALAKAITKGGQQGW